MFENCILLTSLPDISIWNTSNFKNMKSMFMNCKSLTHFPDISKWRIGMDTNIDDLFEGNFLLKVNILKNNFSKNLFTKILKNIIIFFGNIWRKLESYNYNYFSLIIFIIKIIFLCIPILNLYWSYHLDKTNISINNPVEYFNLRNISLSIELLKENQNDFINYVLNYTDINENITFEADERNLKICCIIIGIITPLNIIFLSVFKCKNLNKYIISVKIAFILTLFLILDFVSIITEIFNLIYSNRIRNSLIKYYIVS